MKITFLGGVEEVTGSRYLVESENIKILVDCGMFQGPRELYQRNWEQFPIDPGSIDAIILTHAHIDHTGYIPVLVKNGFKGKIYCSAPTYELTSLLLLDSGFVQEEDAKYANQRRNFAPPLVMPLYTKADAQNSLRFFQPIEYDTAIVIGKKLQVTLISSHHILGSAFVIVSDGKRTLSFSGDLGRPDQLITQTPPALAQTDYLVLESTYGNRKHEDGDPMQELAKVINATVKKGGMLILPSFAVERAQTILYCLYELKQKKIIPNIPIFLDSPLAIKVTELFCQYIDEHTVPASICHDVFNVATATPTADESKKIDEMTSPAIIIAGSGMANGGRVIHHLKRYISDAKNTIAFVGYQAQGTLGSYLVGGAQTVRIHDTLFTVRATITTINALSAHADYEEILAWLAHSTASPKKVFITHGELPAARALQEKIEEQFGWAVVVPKYLASYDLD